MAIFKCDTLRTDHFKTRFPYLLGITFPGTCYDASISFAMKLARKRDKYNFTLVKATGCNFELLMSALT